MTNVTHTPGPWHIEDGRTVWAGDNLVAGVGRIGTPVEANARLIAAAPDLLVALDALLEGSAEALAFLDRDTVEHLVPLLNSAEAAIAKAKGE